MDVALRNALALNQLKLGLTMQQTGKNSEASASYRTAIGLLQSSPKLLEDDVYNLACSHALLAGVAAQPGSALTAAEGRTQADLAMEALRQAVDKRYHDFLHITTDTDLDALRNRDDFRALDDGHGNAVRPVCSDSVRTIPGTSERSQGWGQKSPME